MNRRYFFMGSLAAPLARPVAAQSPDKVGVGMIGVGNRGAHVMQRVMELPATRITALCDIKPDRLDKAASLAARDNPRTYREYRELLANPDVNAVHISTPCDLHVEMSIAALQAGKHIYCEKPAGITPESIARLVRAVKASDRVFVIGQQTRSSRRVQQVMARIRDGILGKVVMIRAQRHTNDDLAHDGPSADWFFNAKRSGDVIVEMSVHNLDVCNWAAGAYPDRAAGFGGALVWANDPPGRTNMDGYTLSYDYSNGVKLSYSQVFFHPSGMAGNGQFTYIFGTLGGIDLNNATFYPRARGAQPQLLAETARENTDLEHCRAFYDAITKGGPNPADIMVGASGALTAILGRDAIYGRRMMTWADLGVTL